MGRKKDLRKANCCPWAHRVPGYIIDFENNLAYIKVREAKIARTKRVTDEVLLDFDRKGQLVGVEVLRWARR